MTSPIEFNPRLCEMSDKGLNLTQRNLIMAFLPYLGAPLFGSDVSRKTFRLVDAALDALEGPLGQWELVWGPGVFQAVPGAIPANTMFVARQLRTGELFIAIAGTNPFSAYAWFVEDFNVSETRAWGYGEAAEGVAISKGTLKGLRALQGMVPPPGSTGENKTLANFLEAYLGQASEPVEVTVSGHSLGGALSPTLALWLLDTRKEWDRHMRAKISVYAYGGPTPGNDDFAAYIDARLGERLHRIANPLDIVPQAWNVHDLAELKAIYAPWISRDTHWDKTADFAIAATNGISYRQIDTSPILLDGKVNMDIVWPWVPSLANYVGQVLYQHTLAYFELLGLAYPEKQSALGRQLAHETNVITREILEHARVWPLPSWALGVALRLVAEVYSRIPYLPSPIPETSVPATPSAR